MNDSLMKELADVNEKIARLEAVRGLLPDEQLAARLAPLRQQKKALEAELAAMPGVSYQAQIKGSGAAAQGPGAKALGQGAVDVSGGKVAGSIVTGEVKAGGDFAGGDKITTSYGGARMDEAGKAELAKLLQELQQKLQQVPAEKQEEAEAVATLAAELVQKAQAEKPNRTAIQISGEGLQKAAQNLAAVMPIVLTMAGQIVAAINRSFPA
ncbi:MAG: hypothetical protein KC418_10805 [Anaerolineales bacterium]|nr:hypothetical protein [Anaerolineales bacterium]